MRRFAGFRFLETGYYNLAVNLFGTKVSKTKDYLASTLAKIKSGEYEIASQIIEEFSNLQWPRLQPEDVFLHFKLYQLLEMQTSLTPAEQKHAEELETQLMELGYPDLDPGKVLDVDSFCVSSVGDR